MYRLFYYLIFGKFPCEHSWILHETLKSNNGGYIKMIYVQKCKHCGNMKRFEVSNVF